jgi:hypothetical protein
MSGRMQPYTEAVTETHVLSEGVTNMLVLFVFGGILLFVGAYLAVDWWLVGRMTKRSLERPGADTRPKHPAPKLPFRGQQE